MLLLVNAFVGGMVGLERTVVPLIGSEEFKLASTTVIASFIASFGISKAFTNLVSGQLADGWGRKRVLVLGWLVGLPVPFLIIWAPSWNWIIAANVLLGISQGLAWSMAVIMKIDLVGPKSRGLAVGLNECSGYLMVGLTAFLTGWIASETGMLRPDPFYLGIGYAVLGLGVSALLVRDTGAHVRLEASMHAKVEPIGFREAFLLTSFRDRNLFAACQAGLVNNLNDGMSWAIFPLFFAARGLGVEPDRRPESRLPRGVGHPPGRDWAAQRPDRPQGPDRRRHVAPSRRALIMVAFAGRVRLVARLQYSARAGHGDGLSDTDCGSLGRAHPTWRARSLSIYRFWRDLGYAVGALLAGVIGDAFGLAWAIGGIGVLTFVSGTVVAFVMREQRVMA